MKTKKILVEIPVDWEEQLSTMSDAWIGKTLYEILGRSPVVEPYEDSISRKSVLNLICGNCATNGHPQECPCDNYRTLMALPTKYEPQESEG